MLGYRITFEGETLYVFDLLVPEIFHEGQRKKNAVDSQDNAASTKPVNSRKGFYLDDIVGTFGVPVEEHQSSLQINMFDGYAVFGISENSSTSTPEENPEHPEKEEQHYEQTNLFEAGPLH